MSSQILPNVEKHVLEVSTLLGSAAAGGTIWGLSLLLSPTLAGAAGGAIGGGLGRVAHSVITGETCCDPEKLGISVAGGLAGGLMAGEVGKRSGGGGTAAYVGVFTVYTATVLLGILKDIA